MFKKQNPTKRELEETIEALASTLIHIETTEHFDDTVHRIHALIELNNKL